ncbi:uncharacterized protein LOC143901837 isoform X2 [Temnothorax americanus]|uniref:uncharacterized protein LOC143901837 isoform X2 n=1 Tax=Temnothorax americanus TaxID=1964332 RepID=UPI00406822FF
MNRARHSTARRFDPEPRKSLQRVVQMTGIGRELRDGRATRRETISTDHRRSNVSPHRLVLRFGGLVSVALNERRLVKELLLDFRK